MLRRLGFLWGLFLALVVVATQAFAVSHAAEHGFEDHDHGEVACEIDGLASKKDLAVPASPAAHLFPPPMWRTASPARAFGQVFVRCNWPPPARAPPRS
jgi:hypothetical protein